MEGAALEGAAVEGLALEGLIPVMRSLAGLGATTGGIPTGVAGRMVSRRLVSAGVVRSSAGISTPSNCLIGSPASTCSIYVFQI